MPTLSPGPLQTPPCRAGLLQVGPWDAQQAPSPAGVTAGTFWVCPSLSSHGLPWAPRWGLRGQGSPRSREWLSAGHFAFRACPGCPIRVPDFLLACPDDPFSPTIFIPPRRSRGRLSTPPHLSPGARHAVRRGRLQSFSSCGSVRQNHQQTSGMTRDGSR